MKQKYLFTLKNINPSQISYKYGIEIFNRINKTSITDLEIIQKDTTVSFVDEHKNIIKGVISTAFFENKNDREYCCFWDRHPIPSNVKILGCPIRYVSDKAVKHHYSEASKITYTIRENVNNNVKQGIISGISTGFSVEEKDYYETDGMFCSFNCCMSFINENKKNPIYEFSEMLLLNIYCKLFPKKTDEPSTILPAPSWKLLIEYGGTLDIDKFRESFNKVEYRDVGSYISVPVGRIFSENIKM